MSFLVEEKAFVVLPQRLGPDVHEGKRRQFNYIGNYFVHILIFFLLKGEKNDVSDGLFEFTSS